MKKLICVLWASAWLTAAYGGESAGTAGAAKKLAAEYTIYSGELGSEKAPTRNQRKLSIEIGGTGARAIFDSMYPDSTVTCSGERGERLRRKRDVWCIFQPSAGYRCFIGVDLRSGASIAGASC